MLIVVPPLKNYAGTTKIELVLSRYEDANGPTELDYRPPGRLHVRDLYRRTKKAQPGGQGGPKREVSLRQQQEVQEVPRAVGRPPLSLPLRKGEKTPAACHGRAFGQATGFGHQS